MTGPSHQAKCIDYVGTHVWPDDWNFVGTDFLKAARPGFIRRAFTLYTAIHALHTPYTSPIHPPYTPYTPHIHPVYTPRVARRLDLGWHRYPEGGKAPHMRRHHPTVCS